jgi:hypothetical protein
VIPSGIPFEIIYAFLTFSMRAARHTRLIDDDGDDDDDDDDDDNNNNNNSHVLRVFDLVVRPVSV